MKSLRRAASSFPSYVLGLLLSLGLVAPVAAGCSSESNGGGTGGSPGGAGGQGGGGGAPAVDPFTLFVKVDAELKKASCAGCHGDKGSADRPFLGGATVEERYISATAWPYIVVKDPNQSRLLTFPDTNDHTSKDAPPMPPEIKPMVLEWLTAEAANLPDGEVEIGPSVPPFRPLLGGAFNTVYLSDLGPEFEYMSISFNADAIGGTSSEPTMLWLTNITVHTVVDKPLHIVHPLFTVYKSGKPADPDPVDSYSNVDQTFKIDGDPTLGTGQVILTNWSKGAYLGLAFGLIEVYGGNAGAGTGCKDIASFVANAVPNMQTCMMKCHGGTNPQAKGTMDLSELNLMDPAAACIEVRARITPGNPDASQILQVTDPIQNVVHMYKFEGDLNKYNDFKTKISAWILAEQQ